MIPVKDAIALAIEHHDLYLQALPHLEELSGNLRYLLVEYEKAPAMTIRQAAWLSNELAKVKEAEPLYGDFKAIKIMFQIAGEHLKRPKIRLLTEEGVFLQLTFIPNENKILLHRDGWQGHGVRKFIGWIEDEVIRPKYLAAITEDMKNMLQAFSLDPQAVAKACALKLGACSFCGSRLTDQESKAKGYGPICAEHFQLPWGSRDEQAIERESKIALADDLSSLFS